MKKVIVLTLALLIAFASTAFAAPQTIDLDTMTVSELAALKDLIDTAIWNAADWEEVTVPQGIWEIGKEIPAGHWTISASDGAYVSVQWGKALNESKTGIDWGKSLDYKSIMSASAYGFDANTQQTSIDWDLADGTFLHIDGGKVVFTPYQGKPAFSFSGAKEKTGAATDDPTPTPSAADQEDAITELEPTPTPIPVPAPTPEPAPTPTRKITVGPSQTPPASRIQYYTLDKGSKGDKIVALQKRLIELKYLSGNADGDYGSKTAQAVTDYQKAEKMSPTGIADPAMQARLFSDDAKENPNPPFDPSIYEKLNYKAVARDPDAFKYNLVSFSGKVIQVIEGGDGGTQYRIATKGSYDDVVLVSYFRPEGSSRILDDDRVAVYGVCLGVISYESTMGGTITIPAAMATRIELK
ncbi:peptidoglycan-binding protein [Bacillota bacterium Meth-B3]